MAEVLDLLLSWIATTVACFYVVMRDERRLPPELLERAWPSASRAAAIVAFWQIAVWVHFWKTRRYGLRGFFLGLFWAVAATMPALAIGFVLDLIFPDSK